MRRSLIRSSIIVFIAAIALFAAACKKSQTPTDAQIASDVQSKVNADEAVQNKQIAVLAANGVVTLSGSVGSEAERSAAAGDAAGVSGVRTVVNNLTVQPAQASMPQNEPQPAFANQPPVQTQTQPPASEPAAEPAATTRSKTAHKPSATGQSRARHTFAQNNAPLTQADAMRQQQSPSTPVQTRESAPPTPPPPPATVTVPDGTALAVRMLDTLDSQKANPGDTFRGTLNSPVQMDGRVVIPADADVFGHVVAAQGAGKFSGSAVLTIEIDKVSFNGRTYAIHTDQWSKQTTGRGKGTAAKVGGGAALGALIGGLAGGGKGAGIGAAVGAGAGGTAQAVTKPGQIKLGPEALLTFHLTQPVTVQPSSSNERNAGRQQMP